MDKWNKWKKRVLIVVLALILNLLGRNVEFFTGSPINLNIAGTILAAYLEGPVVGLVTALISGVGCGIVNHIDFYFIAADLSAAFISGWLGKRNRFFEKTLLTISTTAFMAVVRTVFVLIANYILYGGKTGMAIHDAILDMFEAGGFSRTVGSVVAALHISFGDVLAAMFLLYIGFRITMHIKKVRKSRKLRKALGGKITLSMIAIMLMASIFGTTDSYARTSINFVEKLYDAGYGLVGEGLNDIDMTADGTMWVATYGGLYRFNGSRFTLIDNVKAVRSVQTIYVDRFDRLIVGTQDRGVTLMNIDMSFFTLDASNGLPANAVKDIIADSNDLLYIGTTGGLVTAKIKDGAIVVDNVNTGLGNIKRFSADAKGNVAALNSLGELYLLNGGKVIDQVTSDAVTMTCVRFDGEGNLYVGTDDELVRKYVVRLGKMIADGSIPAKDLRSINDIYFNDDGFVFLAADSGIGYIDDKRHINKIESGNFDNTVETIFKDYQGNLWFTSTRCGLLSLTKSSFGDVFRLCGAKASICNAVIDWNGYLFVGTDDGLRELNIDDGKSVFSRVTAALEGTRVRDLITDNGGNLLVATYGRGLLEITSAGNCRPYISDNSGDKKIRLVKKLKDGSVVTSSEAGLTFIKAHEIENRLSCGKELAGGTILNIIEEPDGTLLAGSDGDGIAVIDNGKVTRYITSEDGLYSGVVLRIVKDTRGSGYFVLTGSGINYMNPDYSIRDLYMPYYNNYDLVMGDNGDVFILGGAGVYSVDYDVLVSGEEFESFKLLDINDGLPGSLTSNAWNYKSFDNILYLCGNNGIYSLDLSDYDMEVEKYKTKITFLKIEDRVYDVTEIGTIEVPRGARKIEFTLELNNYTNSDPEIRYYMSGVDKNKISVVASELESVSYYNLPYGKHEFHIEVVDENDKTLSEQVYIFTKERELYETMGFMIYFYSSFAVFLIFIVISIVQGALMAQSKKSSGQHEKVISILEKEKNEALERALYMQEDASRTKAEFLSKVSRDIRTPINSIIGMDTMIIRESGQEEIRNYAKDIHSAGESLLVMINDILDFSKKENSSSVVLSEEFDLDDLITDLINMAKPAADEKKIKLDVNVDPDIPEAYEGDDDSIRTNVKSALLNTIKYASGGAVTLSVGHRMAEKGEVYLNFTVFDSETQVTNSYEVLRSVKGNSKVGNYERKVRFREEMLEAPEDFRAPEARILIVGSSDTDAQIIIKLLERLEIGIDRAGDGREALDMCYEETYDIIFMDSDMPGTEGEDTMRIIRNECALNENSAIIVFTSDTEKGSREEYLHLGYTNYIARPVDAVKLDAIVRNYLPDEKILSASGDPENEKRSDDEKNKVRDRIRKISELGVIDTAEGISLSNDEETYDLICRNFSETAKGLADRIEGVYKTGDYDKLTSLLNSLKNSVRIIGAKEMTEKAGELENAGHNKETELMAKEMPVLLDSYRNLYISLQKIYSGAN